jgi:Uma2 family endonuclease
MLRSDGLDPTRQAVEPNMSQVLERERVRFRVADFQKMGEAGILSPEDRVELLDGEVVRMAPIGSFHAWSVDRLAALLVLGARERAHVSIQNPLVLSEHSEPQPDLMLLRAPASRYRTELPRVEDVLLLVEVADTTLARDIGVKVPLYARHGIPEVWILDLEGKRLLVFAEPLPSGTYSRTRELGPGDAAAPEALPGLEVLLAEILG